MDVEFEDSDGELEHILGVLAENMEFEDGSNPTKEDVAENLLRQSAGQQYQTLLSQQQI